MSSTHAKRNKVIVPIDEALTAANSALANSETLLNLAYESESEGDVKVKLCALREEIFRLTKKVRDLRNTLWETINLGDDT